MEDEIAKDRKKILYRATYRGTKELDLYFGEFIKQNIKNFDLNELGEIEALVQMEEIDLMKVFSGIDSNRFRLSDILVKKIKLYIESHDRSKFK